MEIKYTVLTATYIFISPARMDWSPNYDLWHVVILIGNIVTLKSQNRLMNADQINLTHLAIILNLCHQHNSNWRNGEY